MAHISSRLEPRRAKMLDLASKTVKGRGDQRVAKQDYHQWARRCEDRTYRHLRDFHCSGDAECDCSGCSCELWTAGRIRTKYRWPGGAHSLDDLGGALRSAEKWARRLGSSDVFLCWLKRNYPKTVAGRHAIEHIMDWIPRELGCVCEIDWYWHGPKGNHGQCTCGAFLVKVNLCRADLSGEDLSGEDLSDVDLSEANLSETNLSGANLFRANLACSNLYNANLRGADLRGAKLYKANLDGADLTGADLRWAKLYKANLDGADLTGADLRWARVCAGAVWPKGFCPRSAGVIQWWHTCR